MTRTHPSCDRHPNLQMITCSIKRTTRQSHGYVCPVPGCGRHRDDEGYFDVVQAKPALVDSASRNRRNAAIMKAMQGQLQPPILPDKQK